MTSAPATALREALRGRAGRGVLLLGALAAALSLGRSWPHDQTVHFVLGDAAPRVEELEACWTETGSDECSREVTYRFARGTAPRVVTDPLRAADGDYAVQIAVVADGARASVQRRVTLGGGVTSIDLSARLPRGREASSASSDQSAR